MSVKPTNNSEAVEYTTNFIVFTEGGEFKWAICDFISGNEYGDNAFDIDNKIIALRDGDGAISKEQLDLLIKEYWEHLPKGIKGTHPNYETIKTTNDDDDSFTSLIDFAGGETEALQLLHENGFDMIDTDAPNQECSP